MECVNTFMLCHGTRVPNLSKNAGAGAVLVHRKLDFAGAGAVLVRQKIIFSGAGAVQCTKNLKNRGAHRCGARWCTKFN